MILLPNTQELELAQQKEISHFKADMEPEGGTEPTDSSDEGDLREASGGYDCTFVEPLPSAFQTECPVCRLLLRDPYQATCCGTNFCQSCIHRVKSKNKLCPTCRKDNFEVFPNKGLKRSIYQLRVFCVHRKDASCPWKGDVWELENHLKEVDHTGKLFHYQSNFSGRHFIPVGNGCKRVIHQTIEFLITNQHCTNTSKVIPSLPSTLWIYSCNVRRYTSVSHT